MDWSSPLTAYLNLGASTTADVGTLLQTLGDACQSAVEQEIGRTFDEEEYTEAYDGNGKRWLYLSHDPITALTSVSVNGNPLVVLDPQSTPTFPPAACIVAGTRDCLELTDGTAFSFGSRNVLVTYKAGLSGPPASAVPPSLVSAVVYWAAMLFKDRDRIGLSSANKMEQTTSYTRTVPADVRRMITNFKRFPRPTC